MKGVWRVDIRGVGFRRNERFEGLFIELANSQHGRPETNEISIVMATNIWLMMATTYDKIIYHNIESY